MIARVSANTYGNWLLFSMKLNGITFTTNYPLFSLDTPLSAMCITGRGGYYNYQSSHPINIAVLINIIGKEALKKLIENIWEATLYAQDVRETPQEPKNLRKFIFGFNTVKSQEGWEYWKNIHNKLYRAGY